MFSFFKKKRNFFSNVEKETIVSSIREAEQRTSGEVRVFVESKCKYMDAIDRAAELFFRLKMEKTDDRNAVLVYIAIDDHQLAVFGDERIHQRVGEEFWQREIDLMIRNFNKNDFAAGISACVREIGEALHTHFPYEKDTDKNELPDEIVFGN